MRACGGRPCQPQCSRVLKGHSDAVRALSLSPDGCVIYSAGYDGTVRGWRTSDGVLLYSLPTNAPVYSLAQSADGEFVFAGTEESLLVFRGSRSRGLRGHAGAVRALACPRVPLSERREHDCDVYSCGDDGTVRGWSAETGACELVLSPGGDEEEPASPGRPPPPLWCLALSRDGETLYSGSEEGGICVWQVGTRSAVGALEQAHSGAIRALVLSRCDGFLFTSGEDRCIRRWSVSPGSERAPFCSLVLRGHGFSVLALALSRCGKLLFSASWDHTLRVWNLEEDGAPLFTAEVGGAGGGGEREENAAVWALALSADSSELHTASSDGHVRAFRVAASGGLSALSSCSLRGGFSRWGWF